MESVAIQARSVGLSDEALVGEIVDRGLIRAVLAEVDDDVILQQVNDRVLVPGVQYTELEQLYAAVQSKDEEATKKLMKRMFVQYLGKVL